MMDQKQKEADWVVWQSFVLASVMNCKVNRLQAIMLFQCNSHAHHSAQRLSIMSQHTPTLHLHCSNLHTAQRATQLQTSVQHRAAQQRVLAAQWSCDLMWSYVRSRCSLSHSQHIMTFDTWQNILWHYVVLHCITQQSAMTFPSCHT